MKYPVYRLDDYFGLSPEQSKEQEQIFLKQIAIITTRYMVLRPDRENDIMKALEILNPYNENANF